MSFTKSTLVTAICGAGLLASSMAFAAPNPALFQAHKDAHIANIQERLQIVQTNLTCTQAAQDHAALMVCQKTANEAHKALAAKLKAKLAEKKAEKAAKKEAAAAAAAPAATPAVEAPAAAPAPAAQ